MSKITINGQQIAQDDLKFFKEGGDVGFSPERNKQIIEDSIKKYEGQRRKRKKEYNEQLNERTEAVAAYLHHLNQGKSTPAEHYFGKRNLAYLRGQKIMQQLVDKKTGMVRLEEVD